MTTQASLNKDDALPVYTDDPVNIGTPPALQIESYITPNERFFVRNHAPIPQVDPATFRLQVDGMVETPLSLSLEALHAGFGEHMITATVVCAGYRRKELEAIAPIPNELIWRADPISTAEWRGVRLMDVLQAAGVKAGAAHIAFLGLDDVQHADLTEPFGGSIPLEKALTPDVLLAYAMNDVPLPPEHGFPLRAVVPGYIGARSVKWLARITVQSEPSSNYYQAKAYRLFPTHIQHTTDYALGTMLAEVPLNSVIITPRDGETIEVGRVMLRGMAIGSGGSAITRVEVSVDGGATWQNAQFENESQAWSWRFWRLETELEAGTHSLLVRAFDANGGSQPENIAQVWNFKGYANNAWHRITVNAQA